MDNYFTFSNFELAVRAIIFLIALVLLLIFLTFAFIIKENEKYNIWDAADLFNFYSLIALMNINFPFYIKEFLEVFKIFRFSFLIDLL